MPEATFTRASKALASNEGNFMSLPKEIHNQIVALPPALVGELGSSLDHLNRKNRGVDLEPECRAWLGADLSRMGEIEPYNWSEQDSMAGEPMRWDAERGSFVIGVKMHLRDLAISDAPACPTRYPG
jgi:hypothetical protein